MDYRSLGSVGSALLGELDPSLAHAFRRSGRMIGKPTPFFYKLSVRLGNALVEDQGGTIVGNTSYVLQT
jgi:hypothetical protein